jgi:hypothetical protein
MTRLLTSYSETFSAGLEYVNAIWDIASEDTSLNGFYICHPDWVKSSYVGTSPSSPYQVYNWYNFLADGSYLQASNCTFNTADAQFNNKPSIVFNSAGSSRLRYMSPVNVGTLLMVYLVNVPGSYIVYAPRSTGGPSPVFYDAFPSGATTLWLNEPNTSGSVYNADSFINGKAVAPTTFIPLNSPRVLGVKNIKAPGKVESVSGYGGKEGFLNGGEYQGGTNSLKGKLVAVITYENDIDIELFNRVSGALAQYYINYTGVQLISSPSFKYLNLSYFTFDFSTVVTDEFFTISNYELISPTNLNLSFTGSVLSGTLAATYEGLLTIKVTNSAGLFSTFTFNLSVCKADPIISSLPKQSNIKLALSAERSGSDLYGLYVNEFGQVTKWEDCRRINNVPVLTSVVDKECGYLATDAYFNNKGSVLFSNESTLTGSVSGKTFLWVYSQVEYGYRNMFNGFPDIKGEGQLWTVSSNNEIHGQTPVTALTTRVQTISVNTLNYKLPLNTPVLISATVPAGDPVAVSGLTQLRGNLAFVLVWDVALTQAELRAAVATLAGRYVSSPAPYIFNTDTEYRTIPQVSIDLTTKCADLYNTALTYTLNNPFYNAAISVGGMLTFTAIKDEVITVDITVTNAGGHSSSLVFDIDIAIRPNPLYLNLKNYLKSSLTTVFIPELDTVTLSGSDVLSQWADYRFNGLTSTGYGLRLVTLNYINGKYAVDYAVDGSSYLDLSSNVSGRCFIVAYIRKEAALNRAFLFGQDSSADFSSGNNGVLYDGTTSTKITNSTTYVNGKAVPSSYVLKPYILNTVIINTTSTVSVDTLAKDRVFTDRSVKGYVACWFVLNKTLTALDAFNVDKLIRDYFDPVRIVTLIHFDGQVEDSSVENKALSFTVGLDNSIVKFGSHAGRLVFNSTPFYIDIPNDNAFVYLHMPFTVSMWLCLNKHLVSTDTVEIYNQLQLLIYLKGDSICVGKSRSAADLLTSYVLPSQLLSTTAYFHVELTHLESAYVLYVNGVSVGTFSYSIEYTDFVNHVRIGQTAALATSGVNLYIDELAIHKGSALHLANFTPPSAPYS